MKMTKNLFGLLSVFALAALLPACGSTSPSDGVLGIEDVVVGTGATVVTGDTVTVNYTGTLTNGTVFDTSLQAGRTPYSFKVGAGTVIPGWDQGLVGMRVGGRRKLTIPPNLAYGSQGNGPIPGNATILFDISLLSIAGK
jgi:peptidylprolyl isomerase/FKBP-type peptidyl-prolyl cis-trans isomerase FkpA